MAFAGWSFLFVGGSFALVGGSLTLVGGSFALCGIAVAVVRVAVAFVGHPLAVVGDPFALVGFAVALVFDAVPLVGAPFALVSKMVAFVGLVVALVGEVVAFFRGAHPFGACDESQFLQPTASLGREAAKIGRPTPFLGGMFTFTGGACSFVGGAKPQRSSLTGMGREELASLRRSPAQPRGERTCLGGSLPKLQGDSLQPGDLVGFMLPPVCGGHVIDSTPPPPNHPGQQPASTVALLPRRRPSCGGPRCSAGSTRTGPASRNRTIRGLDRPSAVGAGGLVRFVGIGWAVTVGRPAVRTALEGVVGADVSQVLKLAVRLRGEVMGVGLQGLAEVGRPGVVGDVFMVLLFGGMIIVLCHFRGSVSVFTGSNGRPSNSTRTVQWTHLLLKNSLDTPTATPKSTPHHRTGSA
ncbi:hypothetical protein [Actinopolymorpha rutila]|uniref:Uncharacterized protein n=1 Tax=Actinopolymorpha rutila TaxID=446787 RepID=A0A852ZJL9_9ACTN|nr:hypothetical protein [Actinopolymorpha rutila]NYH93257.1 hypothetical protein [Actinopolymorpha rutila]